MKEINNSKQFTLFVVDKEGVRFGISCIRWLVENEEPVLYLYEIQLEEQACRKGLGYRVSNIIIKKFGKKFIYVFDFFKFWAQFRAFKISEILETKRIRLNRKYPKYLNDKKILQIL